MNVKLFLSLKDHKEAKKKRKLFDVIQSGFWSSMKISLALKLAAMAVGACYLYKPSLILMTVEIS